MQKEVHRMAEEEKDSEMMKKGQLVKKEDEIRKGGSVPCTRVRRIFQSPPSRGR